MSNEILQKVAELSTYLDNRGHKDEAHALDQRLMRLAQPKTLNIDGVDYASAAEAWGAYDGNKNYRSFASALGLNRPASEDISAALHKYFGSTAPQMPGQAVPGEGSSKPAGEELQWYDPRDWPEYMQKMKPKARDMPRHIERGLEGSTED
jgi:hypothetical protein